MELDGLGDGSQIDAETVREGLVSETPVEGVNDLRAIESGLNAVYRASVSLNGTSEEVIVKFGTFTPTREFGAEPLVLAELNGSDVPTPSLVHDATVTYDSRYPWYVMSASPGVEASEVKNEVDIDQLGTISRNLGRSLGLIHRQKLDCAGELVREQTGTRGTRESADVWAEVFNERALVLASQADPRFTNLHSDISETLDATHVLSNFDDFRMLHLDYWWENILVSPDDLSVTSVIDWGRAVGGDPVLNLATAEFMLFENPILAEIPTDVLRQHFRDGYCAARTPREGTDTKIWALYQLYARLRAFRGFPYWYRGESIVVRDRIANRLRDDVRQALNFDPISPPPF